MLRLTIMTLNKQRTFYSTMLLSFTFLKIFNLPVYWGFPNGTQKMICFRKGSTPKEAPKGR
ncbi:MAG: hypothetical protein APF81_14515 [Desulfosporosinus sp. BRH_c37]|nr:MAG: hypothetical protein APF81_14515 [Desulfosporosinus sp. BRH_c37]